MTSEPTPTDTGNYWGGQKNIERFTPYCKSYTFVHQDTVDRGYDDPTLTREYCVAAAGSTMNTTRIVENTLIFGHSMGNLIFAEALRTGVCSLGNSSKWFTISPLWRGSKAADWVGNICDGKIGKSIMRKMATSWGYCNGTGVNEGYRSIRTDSPGLSNGVIEKVGLKWASGGICGDSAYGLNSVYSLQLFTLATLVNFGEENDGMVAFSECQLPGKTYEKKNCSATWYNPSINHVDSTMRNGDGSWGYDRKPASWMASLPVCEGGLPCTKVACNEAEPLLVRKPLRTARWTF